MNDLLYLRPFVKGTRVRFSHHPVEPEGHPEPPVSALPEAGEYYYKPLPAGSVPHGETYFKVEDNDGSDVMY